VRFRIGDDGSVRRHAGLRRGRARRQLRHGGWPGSGVSRWLFRDGRGKEIVVEIAPEFSTNSAWVMRDAAVFRMWCRELPTFLIEPELVRGDLVPVLCDFQPRQFDIVALYAAAIRAAARARLLIDRLVEALGGDDPPWDRRLRQQGLI
jgi:DNA-binding transcriptional LysR family regulator